MYHMLIKDDLKSTAWRVTETIKSAAEVLAEYVGTDKEMAARCMLEALLEAKRCVHIAEKDFETVVKLAVEKVEII